MSLDPERMSSVYPVFAWLEIAERLTTLADGALGEAIRQGMNGRRLGDDAPFDLTDDERVQVQAVVAEEDRSAAQAGRLVILLRRVRITLRNSRPGWARVREDRRTALERPLRDGTSGRRT